MARRKRIRVEEYDHAYLVRGTNLVPVAKKALWEHLGRKKWTRINRMPARPLWTGEFEPRAVAESAVALYFNMMPPVDGCEGRCCNPRDRYKP